MGWASASGIVSTIIEVVEREVSSKDIRKRIYKDIIEEFENSDWDTQDECMGEDDAFDEVMKELHPDWFEEDED